MDPGMTKNREGRVFPFTADLRKLLEDLKEKNQAMRAGGVISPLGVHLQRKAVQELLQVLENSLQEGRAAGDVVV